MKVKKQVMVEQEEWHYACDICLLESPQPHLPPDGWYELVKRHTYYGPCEPSEREKYVTLICPTCSKAVREFIDDLKQLTTTTPYAE